MSKPPRIFSRLAALLLASIALNQMAQPVARGDAPVRGAAPIDEASLGRMIDLNREALAEIQISHFAAAKHCLEEALVIAESVGLDSDDMMARTYVHLAILYLTGMGNRNQAVRQFLCALKINPNITITDGFATPALKSAYLFARRRAGLPPRPEIEPTAAGQVGRGSETGEAAGSSSSEIPRVQPAENEDEAEDEAEDDGDEEQIASSEALEDLDPANRTSLPGEPGTSSRRPQVARAIWFSLGTGTGSAYHGRETVDSNARSPGSNLPVASKSGFTQVSLFQIEPELGYQLDQRLSISFLARYQFAPKDMGAHVPGAGEKDIPTSALAGFVHLRFAFLAARNFEAYALAGPGLGNSFLAVLGKKCDASSCTMDHSDTLHGGPLAFSLGVGATYHFAPSLGVFLNLKEIATLPKFMALTEFNLGFVVTHAFAKPRREGVQSEP